MQGFVIAIGGSDAPPKNIESRPYASLHEALCQCPPGHSVYDQTTGKWLNMVALMQDTIEWISATA